MDPLDELEDIVEENLDDSPGFYDPPGTSGKSDIKAAIDAVADLQTLVGRIKQDRDLAKRAHEHLHEEITPLEVRGPGLYRIRYTHLGINQTFTARQSGATKDIHGVWIPIWELDPEGQLGINVGTIQNILSVERIGD